MACSIHKFDITQGIVPQSAQQFSATTSVTWCDFVQLVNNIIGLIFYIALPVATVMIMYGGFLFLTAGGKDKQVAKGKTIITSAIIGLAIVLGVNIILRSIFIAIGIDISRLPWG
ncbi:MAG: pilin [Candidatus Colwellbacteria bacterium]|nr:pilin [Candidatus Colwellbacteria bacterium]